MHLLTTLAQIASLHASESSVAVVSNRIPTMVAMTSACKLVILRETDFT
jgi:hypothetical protein